MREHHENMVFLNQKTRQVKQQLAEKTKASKDARLRIKKEYALPRTEVKHYSIQDLQLLQQQLDQVELKKDFDEKNMAKILDE